MTRNQPNQAKRKEERAITKALPLPIVEAKTRDLTIRVVQRGSDRIHKEQLEVNANLNAMKGSTF